MTHVLLGDWGVASERFDAIKSFVSGKDLVSANEAQTRFDVIDRMIREVLDWKHGQISVEEYSKGEKEGFVDYLLRQGDNLIVIEAKKAGVSFPSPTQKLKLKLSGSVLGDGEIAKAINQAEQYAVQKRANIVLVTNGLCWCFYSLADKSDDSYATVLFPFTVSGHAEQLFTFFCEANVENGSLNQITNKLPPIEDRLITAIKYADARIDRNNIADFITPALNNAMYADALLANPDILKKCYVSTEARVKYDSTLGMHLADPKSIIIKPAKRIQRGKSHGELEKIVETSTTGYAPPVTLIIGPVGVGKSTYLRHFETISGREVLDKQLAHWIYVDFEQMGRTGDPRKFMYSCIREYLLDEHPNNPTIFEKTIKPAYKDVIDAMARGPYALIYRSDKKEFDKKITELIENDFNQVEPYVEKLMRHMSKTNLCVVVLDNVDLYEDEILETNVFSEGLALSKRIMCNVLISIRDTTFIRHRTDSTFNAYEFRKLWLDPPPFKAVLSNRLSYSKIILKDKAVRLTLGNGMQLNVPDLSIFFEIVQRSILHDQAGDYIEAMADLNIRKGLTMVSNFLTSGHLNGDRAIRVYLEEVDSSYRFPFHEVFKGTILGQWMHFREDRAEGVNLFDARLGSRQTRLLRLLLLNYLMLRAQHESTVETRILDVVDIFSRLGASESQMISCVEFLSKRGLVKNVTAEDINLDSTIILTRNGGFYSKILSRKHVYVEECMFDTAIEDTHVWDALYELTMAINAQSNIVERWKLRRERTDHFTNYLCDLEDQAIELIGKSDQFISAREIREAVLNEANDAISKSIRWHS